MNLRYFLFLCLDIWLFSCCAGNTEKLAEISKPNILFILTDDQQYQTLELAQQGLLEAPAMDSLASAGIKFTNAHIMGAVNGAVCAPSRAMLLSGRSLFNIDPTGDVIDSAYITLPQHLQANGYHTYHIGKWHNDKPSFVRSFSGGSRIFFGGMSDQYKVPLQEFDPQRKYLKATQYSLNKHSSEIYADAAVDFLEKYDSTAPFFLYLAFQTPHDPKQVSPDFQGKYDPEKLEVSDNFLPIHPFDNGELDIRDEWLASSPRKAEVVKKHMADYYSMVSHLDINIGRVFDVLRKKGLDKNTIIVFTSDNGLALGQHGLMGKQNVYEHSVKVPLVISGPGVEGKQKTNTPTYLIDLYPTICDLAGIQIPSTVQGKSLAGVMTGGNSDNYEGLVFAYKHFQRALLKDDWKLIEYNVKGNRHTQLFNLAEDPFESNNLADKAEMQDRVRILRKVLQEQMFQLNDPVKINPPDWGVETIESWVDILKERNPKALENLRKLAKEERRQYADTLEINSDIRL